MVSPNGKVLASALNCPCPRKLIWPVTIQTLSISLGSLSTMICQLLPSTTQSCGAGGAAVRVALALDLIACCLHFHLFWAPVTSQSTSQSTYHFKVANRLQWL